MTTEVEKLVFHSRHIEVHLTDGTPPWRLRINEAVPGKTSQAIPTAQATQLRVGHGIGIIFQEAAAALNPVYRIGNQIADVIRLHRGLARRDAWSEAVKVLAAMGIHLMTGALAAPIAARELPKKLRRSRTALRGAY